MKAYLGLCRGTKNGCVLIRKRQDGGSTASRRLSWQPDISASQPVNKDFLGSLWAEHMAGEVPERVEKNQLLTSRVPGGEEPLPNA